MRQKTCCFSGHRPEKIPCSGQPSMQLYNIKIALYQEIDKAIKNGYEYFVDGACRGVDFWAAEHVLWHKNRNPMIQLEFAIPFDLQAAKWCEEDKIEYHKLLKQADKITKVNNAYTLNCMQKRNEYMVDKSSLIIAVWNGKPSGTKNCLDYAVKKGLEIKVVYI